MHAPDDRLHDSPPIDELVRRAMSDRVPQPVRERLQSQLDQLRSQVAERELAAPTVRRLRSAWGIGLAAAAAIAVAATVLLALRPQNSLADVAAAVLKQPWIHVVTTRGDRSMETWYSPVRGVTATRQPQAIEYRDHRLQVYYKYVTQEQVLYRGPDMAAGDPNHFEELADDVMALLAQERTVAEPLAKLDFLGERRAKMTVLEQSVEKVNEDGRSWLDYRIKVRGPEEAEPWQMLFRADAATRLLQLWRLEGKWKGEPVRNETRFDYPAQGPLDIFALGVPQDAKFVDRIPTGDLKRILQTLQAGRDRMDNYRAIVVSLTAGVDPRNELPSIMYRKGDKLRTDLTYRWTGGLFDAPAPAADEDMAAWWRKRSEFFRFCPTLVIANSTAYFVEMSKNADGSTGDTIETVRKRADFARPGDTYPADYSMRPEFGCRPPMGVGDPHLEPVLEPNPQEGPAGCMLLRIRHTTREGRINEQGIGLPDENRFWLDPKRDYIVVRWDMMTVDDAGQSQIHESDTLEEAARSPQGVWYATRIRRHFPLPAPNGEKMADSVYHIFVDFQADLPDSLFDPPVPGKLP